MSYRDEARRALESSAARKSQNEYLKQLQDRHPSLQQFQDTDALLALLRAPEADRSAKDAALLALVEEHQRGGGGGAFALLASAMFPMLDHLHRSRWRKAQDPDDLWGRIVAAFAEALDRYPVERRPAKVAANIQGDTMASLRRARERERRSSAAQSRFVMETEPYLKELVAVDPRERALEQLGLGDFVAAGTEEPAPPDADEVRAAERALDPFIQAEVINEGDRFLVLGVHLYERTLGELAQELGISREAAKKRHLRAMTRLRRSRSDIQGGDAEG